LGEQIILIGLQDSGKSTFLAALYHVVESGQIDDSLHLGELGPDRTYLNELRERWLNCEKLDRTKLGHEQVLQFQLISSDGTVIDVILPDVSGETFRDQWEQRKTTIVFDDLARRADGVLFFIHPDTVRKPVRINFVRAVAAVLDDLDVPATSTSSGEGLEIKWSPKLSPTAVQLTEVLQFLVREPEMYPVKRVAVIVSAWDLLQSDFQKPSEWLAKDLPLLSQFLKANSDSLPYKVFGISAQGGPLEQAGDLRSRINQSDRVLVASDEVGEYGIHDITAPIKWLMQIENAVSHY